MSFKRIVPLLLIILNLTPAWGSEIEPLNDNILFAFDRCRVYSVDLGKTLFQEESAKSFDMHCIVAHTDKKTFKCDYFDTGSSKRGDLENFQGGKTEKMGYLTSKGGTLIRFSFAKGSASYESVLKSSDGMNDGRKMCAGIFILEKEALKRKK